MKVSVIVPMYNSEKYIADTIESVLRQTFNDFELIIINDSSTDRSDEIVKEFVKVDDRIKYINNTEKKGQSGARNSGLNIAKGEYIALIDSDDKMRPKRLAIQVKFLDEHPNVGVVGTWLKEFGNTETISKVPSDSDSIKAHLIISPALLNPSVMMRKNVLIKNKIRYRTEFDFAEDYELWVQLMKVTDFANIPQLLTMYRIHGKNVSIEGRDKMIESWSRTVSNLLCELQIEPNELYITALDVFDGNNFANISKSQRVEIVDFCKLLINQNNIIALFPTKAFNRLINKKIKEINAFEIK